MNDESPPMLTKERNLLVFYEEAKQNGFAPGQFNKVLMMRVTVPGDQSSMEYWVDEEYPEAHKHPTFGALRKNDPVYTRFGEYIKAYKENNKAMLEAGTPLEAWPVVNRAQVAMLRYHGIHSVEALSGINDEQMTRIGIGTRDLVNKAKTYLQGAADTTASLKMEAEKKAIQDRFDALEAKYQEIMEAVSELPEDAKAILGSRMKKNQEKPKRVA